MSSASSLGRGDRGGNAFADQSARRPSRQQRIADRLVFEFGQHRPHRFDALEISGGDHHAAFGRRNLPDDTRSDLRCAQSAPQCTAGKSAVKRPLAGDQSRVFQPPESRGPTHALPETFGRARSCGRLQCAGEPWPAPVRAGIPEGSGHRRADRRPQRAASAAANERGVIGFAAR